MYCSDQAFDQAIYSHAVRPGWGCPCMHIAIRTVKVCGRPMAGEPGRVCRSRGGQAARGEEVRGWMQSMLVSASHYHS
jgi:hypothetical protein